MSPEPTPIPSVLIMVRYGIAYAVAASGPVRVVILDYDREGETLDMAWMESYAAGGETLDGTPVRFAAAVAAGMAELAAILEAVQDAAP